MRGRPVDNEGDVERFSVTLGRSLTRRLDATARRMAQARGERVSRQDALRAVLEGTATLEAAATASGDRTGA